MTIAARITSPLMVRRLVQVLFTSFLFYFGISLLHYHYLLVTFPYPLEYREGAVLFTTDLLLKGGNPYALENMPVAMNVYGINYHLVVYPFARLWGATFLVHRGISALCLQLSCLLFFVVLRKHRVSALYSLAGTLLLYAALLYRYTPLARPDGLGILLFLLSIFVAYLGQYSTRSLLISAVLGIAAFYTKAYFVLSIPYLAAYLFLFISKKKALAYGLFSVLVLLGTAYLVNARFETYFLNTFFNHINVAANDTGLLAAQLSFFLNINSGLVLLGSVYACLVLIDRAGRARPTVSRLGGLTGKLGSQLDISHVDQPLLKASFPLPLFCLLCSFGIFYFKMGRHNGNIMTYAYHLMTPFFLLSIFSLFSIRFQKPRLARLTDLRSYMLRMPCILLSLYLSYVSASLSGGAQVYTSTREWQRVESITLSYENILNSPVITGSLLEQGKVVYDAGQTVYFQYSHYTPDWLQVVFPSNSTIAKQWEMYENSIDEGVRSQAFDAIIITSGEHRPYLAELQSYYVLVGTAEIHMFHTMQIVTLEIWEPRSTSDNWE